MNQKTFSFLVHFWTKISNQKNFFSGPYQLKISCAFSFAIAGGE